MRKIYLTSLALLLALMHLAFLQGGTVYAQQDPPPEECLSCFSCSIVALPIIVIMVIIVIFLINIALLVWVARDAKIRGMDNPVIWMLLVFFTGFIGLIIYLLARTQGYIIICENCNNKKLEILSKCPHCEK